VTTDRWTLVPNPSHQPGGDPDDLAIDTEAWVDGQVLLEHEREPDVGGVQRG
jgi:hypothetical protein